MNIIKIQLRKIIYLFLALMSTVLGNESMPAFILTYHSISDDNWFFSVKLEEFKKQINYLRENFEIISLSDLEKYIKGNIKFDKPVVVITFDDGYRNILSIRDFYKNIKVKPTVFLIAETKLANYEELKTTRDFLSKNDVNVLLKDGWEIGSHTITHPDMYKLTGIEIEKEVLGSKKIIEKNFNKKVKYISYPKGKYTNEIVNFVNKAGYSLGFTMNDEIIDSKINKLKIPRIGVNNTHSFWEFKYLSYPLLSKFRKYIK